LEIRRRGEQVIGWKKVKAACIDVVLDFFFPAGMGAAIDWCVQEKSHWSRAHGLSVKATKQSPQASKRWRASTPRRHDSSSLSVPLFDAQSFHALPDWVIFKSKESHHSRKKISDR